MPGEHVRTCACRGECGRRHMGGKCAIPNKVDIRLHESDAGVRWGWHTLDTKGGENRATRLGFGPVVRFEVKDDVCGLCGGYTGLGGGHHG